ncbi:G patch domain-containing protein 4 [Mixophyes fleayi]|uniref:G patch domain-containing protein 4 n=1 Tax=Mixophyes fleayi TaxID=3061075 RepID=UPI003F4DF1C5
MAAESNGKSQGMKFAVDLLHRHGWTEGKGLGKREDGISEALKVKVKSDAAGVGHNPAEQFTFHWWDHVFNKTASSLSVEPDEDGVQVKKLTEDNTTVSNKKPRKALSHPNMLYGRFIKSATLLSGGEKPVEELSPSDSDSSEDEDAKLDLSSATKMTDEDLMKICGGRTAHKGARHGLTMSAKLSRIEEQERAFMEKYGKKEPSKYNAGGVGVEDRPSDTSVPKKKNRKRADGVEVVEDVVNGHDQEHAPSIDEENITSKKKKKRKMADSVELVEDVLNGHDQEHAPSIDEENITSKKKKKRKMADSVELVEDVLNGHDQEHAPSIDEENITSKKKKKRKMADSVELVEDVLNGHDQEHAPSIDENITSKKKKKKMADRGAMMESKEAFGCSTEEETIKPSKKKKKRTEDKEELVVDEVELNGHRAENGQTTEEEHTRPAKKKKWKTEKDNKHEEEQDLNTEKEERKSKKKKRRTKAHTEDEEQAPQTEEEDAKIRKKKSKHKHRESPPGEETELLIESTEHCIKSKKKRKNKSE